MCLSCCLIKRFKKNLLSPLCFPSQAFTVVAVFNSMTFALKVTPLAVRALSEGSVAVKRFQVIKEDEPLCLSLSLMFTEVNTLK